LEQHLRGMRTHKNREVEVKLPVIHLAALRRRLRQLQARKQVRVHEMNTLYDTPRGRFWKRDILLRLRLQRPQNARRPPHKGLLTFKGPTLRPADLEPRGGWGVRNLPYKVREELEIRVSEPHKLHALLQAVGLVPAFRYEKFRTTYTLPSVRGVQLELDETPIGVFVELEGSPGAIDRAAHLLGYTLEDYISRSYQGLYRDHCRRHGIPPGEMLFPARRPS